MHLISLKKLREFWAGHADARLQLRAWAQAVRRARWRSFADVREVYADADMVGRFVIFNICRNKYRLIAVVHFNRGKVYVRHILTHAEYDRGKWKDG